MTKLILLFLTGLLSIYTAKAQTSANYYVASEVAILYSKAFADSEVVKELKQYDNLLLLEGIEGKAWVKVRFKKQKGYVSTDFIKKGKVVTTTQEVRIGANCKDGSTSSATGPGACSRHGGVSSWRHRIEEKVTIIDNQSFKEQNK